MIMNDPLLYEMRQYFNKVLTGEIMWRNSTRQRLEELLAHANKRLNQPIHKLPPQPTTPATPDWLALLTKHAEGDSEIGVDARAVLAQQALLLEKETLLRKIRKNSGAFPGVRTKPLQREIKRIRDAINKDTDRILKTERSNFSDQCRRHQSDIHRHRILVMQRDNMHEIKMLAFAIEQHLKSPHGKNLAGRQQASRKRQKTRKKGSRPENRQWIKFVSGGLPSLGKRS
jgi:hypothetical protein